MTDRPITFTAPEVRAVLDGRKTQFRKVLNSIVPPPPAHDNVVHDPRHPAPYLDAYCSKKKTDENPRGMSTDWCWWTRDDRCGQCFTVPYAPGGRLWVRETWTQDGCVDGMAAYGVDGHDFPSWVESGKWRSPVTMPRWASRISLLVTDVRVERLQDISEADAIAEGNTPGPSGDTFGGCRHTAIAAFSDHWISRHGPASWDANPWVVAITFEHIDGGDA